MRVFLSSTSVDLVTHRRAAADALERLDQQVGRMELFGARPEEPVTACIDEIDRCSIFVGIYAHRYGFVPTGSTISITELEFNHAHERGKSMFCFLVSDTYDGLHDSAEEPPAPERLLEFKKRIATLYTIDRFTNEDNLSFLVATSVGRFLARFSDPARSADSLIPDVLVTGIAALSRGMAMLCVDLMRLLSIQASPAVRSANRDRYGQFLDMAAQRLADLRSTYILFAKYLTPDIAAQVQPLDTQLSWLLLRLRQDEASDHRSVMLFADALYDISGLVQSLCDLSLAGEYDAVRKRVTAAAARHTGAMDSIERICEARLAIQSDLIAHQSIRSIVEDRHQKLAVEYFCLDRQLLESWRLTAPRTPGS